MASFTMEDQSIMNSTSIANATDSSLPSLPPSPSHTFQTPAPVTHMAESNDNIVSSDELDRDKSEEENAYCSSKEKEDQREKLKAEKKAIKKIMKELTICKVILEEMEVIQLV